MVVVEETAEKGREGARMLRSSQSSQPWKARGRRAKEKVRRRGPTSNVSLARPILLVFFFSPVVRKKQPIE